MLEVRYVNASTLRREHTPRLLRYLLDRGADEFTITVMALQDTLAPFADAFEDELGPFERDMASRRMVTASMPGEVVRPVRIWELNEASLARLLTFLDDGLFHSPAGPDGWLEDLAVFRAGELVLGVASHESEGVLRLTPGEHREVTALGIPTEPTAESIEY